MPKLIKILNSPSPDAPRNASYKGHLKLKKILLALLQENERAAKENACIAAIEENPALNSIAEITRPVLHALVQAAQKEYDKWSQDADGYDEEVGYGGICQLIADELVCILSNHDIYNCEIISSNSEPHVYVMGCFKEGIFTIDIPWSIYERGSGYVWKKLPNVVFDEDHIVIDCIDPNPANFSKYIEYN
jgi:hypothetical protein